MLMPINRGMTMMINQRLRCLLAVGFLAVVHAQRRLYQQGPKNPVWSHLLDVQSPELNRQYATPLLWHIHKAGGTTLHDYFGSCLNLTIAAEVGIKGHEMDQQLRHVVVDERSYINVDTTTDEGIEHAYRLGFQNVRHVAEVVITPLILPTTAYLFSDGNKAMMFTLMRHPVDRTISMFYYLQGATWEPTYNEQWASMTLLDYINSDFVESNWMVRFLVGKPEGFVDEHDLEEAKAILRDKCWIGLQRRMDESVQRFGQLFGWNQHPKWQQCIAGFGKKRSNKNINKKSVDHDSDEWQLLTQINHLDLKLFSYALNLYNEQGNQFFPQWQEAA